MRLDELVLRFRGPVRWEGRSAWVFCSVHADGAKSGRQSLHLTESPERGILCYCFAGCATEAVVAAVGVTLAELMPPKPTPLPRAHGQPIATYEHDYRDKHAHLVFQVVRREYADGSKDFKQRRPDPARPGQWLWDMKGVARTLYRFHELRHFPDSRLPRGWVLMVEGDKLVDRLMALKIPATTSSGGAGKWHLGGDAYLDQLMGVGIHTAVLCPDFDGPGWSHMADVLQAAGAHGGVECRWLTLDGLELKQDLADWLDRGGTVEQLVARVQALHVTTEPPPMPTTLQLAIAPPEGTQARTEDLVDPADHLTDAGNASRFVAATLDGLRYCPARGWLEWDGRRWRPNEDPKDDSVAVRAVIAFLIRRYLEIPQVPPDERPKLLRHLTRSEAAGRIQAIVNLASADARLQVSPVQLDADPFLFTCLNGTLNLKTGELQPHRREDLITKLSPVAYDPEAPAPRFQRFLEEIFPKSELRPYVQKVIGYALTGDTREQTMFLLYGFGANGKSTLIEAVRVALGDYAQAAQADTFLAKRTAGPTNDLAALHGVRAAFAAEPEAGRALAESLIKEVTGGEPIRARFLYKELFEFRPRFKLFLSTNHKPSVRGTDQAIWRRLRLVPFTQSFLGREDKTLAAVLKREATGILAWAVEGCRRWLTEGLVPPREVLTSTSEYRAEQDILGEFLSQECELGPEFTESVSSLYRAYIEWATSAGEDRLSKRKLGMALRDRGLAPAPGHNDGRRWLGVRVRLSTGVPMDDLSPGQRRDHGVF